MELASVPTQKDQTNLADYLNTFGYEGKNLIKTQLLLNKQHKLIYLIIF